MDANTEQLEQEAKPGSCYALLEFSLSEAAQFETNPRLARFGIVMFMGYMICCDPNLTQRPEEVLRLVQLAILFTMTERLIEDRTAGYAGHHDLIHRHTWMKLARTSWVDRACAYLKDYKPALYSLPAPDDTQRWRNTARPFIKTLTGEPAFLTKTVLDAGFARDLPGLWNSGSQLILQAQSNLRNLTSKDNRHTDGELHTDAMLFTIFLENSKYPRRTFFDEITQCRNIVVQLAKQELHLGDAQADHFDHEISVTHDRLQRSQRYEQIERLQLKGKARKTKAGPPRKRIPAMRQGGRRKKLTG